LSFFYCVFRWLPTNGQLQPRHLITVIKLYLDRALTAGDLELSLCTSSYWCCSVPLRVFWHSFRLFGRERLDVLCVLRQVGILISLFRFTTKHPSRAYQVSTPSFTRALFRCFKVPKIL
jgi:hypothetical protein